MRLYTNPFLIEKNNDTIITIGTFDGVHLGHKKIFDVLLHSSEQFGCRNVVLTFEPHPRVVVDPNFDLKLLTTFDEKAALLEELGIEHLVVVPFTKEFSDLSSEDFINTYIIQAIGVKKLVIGYDHRFGKGRDGDEQKIRSLAEKNGFDVQKAEAVSIGDAVVSSSKIRNALLEGDVKTAAGMLGRNYSYSGIVVAGDKRGRTLGFPTANIQLDNQHKVVPKNGVYAVRVTFDGRTFNGMMNIGYRPTFKNTASVLSEVHLLNFNEDIYGKRITVSFCERIRDEKKFESKEALIQQIENDKLIIHKLLSTN